MKFVLAYLLSLSVSLVLAQNKLPDGLYLVDRMVEDAAEPEAKSNQKVIRFNPQFTLDDPTEYSPVLIWTDDFVPFELATAPETQQQTADKKLLLLRLTPAASAQLTRFSTKNLRKSVVIVVNGEALTMHKIKEPLTSGLMQISRCTDNACAMLYEVLKQDVKH
jgi:preprotein translocase subunit SecD